MNKILKKFFPALVLLSLIFFSFAPALAQEREGAAPVEIIFFGSPTCPHCLSLKHFLEDLKEEYPEIMVREYDFSENIDRAKSLYESYQVPAGQQGLVPVTFMDELFFVGFNDNIGQTIGDYVAGLEIDSSSEKITLPIFGEIDVVNYSLPVLAIILGVVDGFNVCSLGALVIILGLVMVLRSRKRILLVGGCFLLTTVAVYGLLIFLWYKFFSFISPYIRSLEIFIGLLALAGGVYLLRQFFKALKQGVSCQSGGIIEKLTPRVQKIFEKKTNLAFLLGVVALFAVAVTVVEFPCSAFLPVLFTSIMVEMETPPLTSFFYMLLYLFFYMTDELIIFLIAIATLKIRIVSPKFINIFNLIAALIFLFLGVYYLFGFFA